MDRQPPSQDDWADELARTIAADLDTFAAANPFRIAIVAARLRLLHWEGTQIGHRRAMETMRGDNDE